LLKEAFEELVEGLPKPQSRVVAYRRLVDHKAGILEIDLLNRRQKLNAASVVVAD